MKKRLKKKVLKQMATKIERMRETNIPEAPTHLEIRIGESIFARELGAFQKQEFDNGTLYQGDYLARLAEKVREINSMFSPEGLREQAKKL